MSLIRVQPDTTYAISEVRLRFEAPADIPDHLVPFHVAQQLAEAIAKMEKFKGCKFIDRIPDQIKFCGKPCCTQIALGLPGQPVKILFERSAFQGDTDDAHNFGAVSDPDSRIEQDNLVDWVAVTHFWEPAIWIQQEEVDEFKNLGEKDGYVHRDNMPDRTPLSQKDLAAAAGQKVWHRAAEKNNDSSGIERLAEGASGLILPD